MRLDRKREREKGREALAEKKTKKRKRGLGERHLKSARVTRTVW